MYKKILAFIITITVIAFLLSGCGDKAPQENTAVSKPESYDEMMSYWKNEAEDLPIVCWYSDETDKDWLETSAKEFEKQYGIPVNVVRYDGVQMLEDINRSNREGSGPDMYITGNDQLEFAVLGGIVTENTSFDDDFWKENYPEVAKRALTYKEKQYGYPLYFDTYCLVYDAELLNDAPASIDDILVFLDEYEDTGSTKAVFRWDVADPYINTMFVAAYADLFGENGDDGSSFMINGDKETEAMKYYQSLSEFLWMDKTNISHETVINRIKEGTLVLGLCKSDILPVLYEMSDAETDNNAGEESDAGTGDNAGEETDAETGDNAGEETEAETGDNAGEETEAETGDNAGGELEAETGDNAVGESETETGDNSDESKTNYKISYVPSLTADLSSACLSTTYGAFINPYGSNNKAANMFALYLSCGAVDKQFSGNGRLPVKAPENGFDDLQMVIYAQYINSKAVPKVMSFGDYIQESGITYDAIWEGADAKEELDKLQEIMERKLK